MVLAMDLKYLVSTGYYGSAPYLDHLKQIISEEQNYLEHIILLYQSSIIIFLNACP